MSGILQDRSVLQIRMSGEGGCFGLKKIRSVRS
jgi:hypothetical protein